MDTLGPDLVSGLDASDAAVRLARDGPNLLPAPPGPSLIGRVGRQLASPLVLALLVAGITTIVVLGEVVEGTAILAIVVINVLIETRQEVRSDAAVQALSGLTAPTARVRRSGFRG